MNITRWWESNELYTAETAAWKRVGKDGLILLYEVNGNEMRHINWVRGTDLKVYSMYESSRSRLSLSILFDVLSWMINVVIWLLGVKWCIFVLFEINWDILNY